MGPPEKLRGHEKKLKVNFYELYYVSKN